MEIPLDLERRLEKRWAARVFSAKRMSLKDCIKRMPRPVEAKYPKYQREPTINGLGSVKKPILFGAAPSATAPRTAL